MSDYGTWRAAIFIVSERRNAARTVSWEGRANWQFALFSQRPRRRDQGKLPVCPTPAPHFSFYSTTRCGADFPGLILFDESLALFDRQEFVSIHVRYLVNHAARPANFNEVYFHPLLQAEVQPKVVLRYITPAASRFANLR